MFRLILLCFICSFSITTFAQNNGTIKGRVVDQTNGESIEYASVALYSTSDSTLLHGIVTDENGKFEFQNLPKDAVYLTAQFLGYQTYNSKSFQPIGNLELGDIHLGFNENVLKEIEVTGKEITSLHKLDKQVFDAKQFQQSQGGNASDVLSNLPSVSMNSFGDISVRGSTGFQVMINGKPVQIDPAVVLAQISANSIEDIEIITYYQTSIIRWAILNS
jgi:hypothetical protein